jgi:hypothetical protein
MNNNTPILLRTLIIYAICVPLAIIVGYTLSSPLDRSSLGFIGIFGFVLTLPIFMRWHYPLLVFLWLSAITLNFVPGSPTAWLYMVVLSLGLSVLERILSRRMHFIKVPQITWPLIFMFAVVMMTAEMTGGIGLRAMGSATYGGKKYVYLLISIFSYFALTSRRIPQEKAGLFVGLFFLGKLTMAIGDTYPIAPSFLHFLYFIFPPASSYLGTDPLDVGNTRLGGVAGAAMGGYFWLMARYGIRGIFLSGKPWRPCLFVLFFVLIFLGGFRSSLAMFLVSFVIMFFLEGLYRTPLLVAFGLAGILGCVAIVPLASHLPFTFQRTLAFLPLNLSPDAVRSAQDSSEWRFKMWEALLPQIPPHLLLGKGFAISQEDFNELIAGGNQSKAAANFDAANTALAVSSDYHNGMLSVILPFGIWGVLVTLWFLWAGVKVMYRNMKYGNPALHTANQFLFVLFFIEAAQFASCVSGLSLASELQSFVGYLGLSIALNNGVCAPVAQPVKQVERASKIFPHLRPAPFPR